MKYKIITWGGSLGVRLSKKDFMAGQTIEIIQPNQSELTERRVREIIKEEIDKERLK